MVIILPSLITQLNEARERYLDLVSQVQNSNIALLNENDIQLIASATYNQSIEYTWTNRIINTPSDTFQQSQNNSRSSNHCFTLWNSNSLTGDW